MLEVDQTRLDQIMQTPLSKGAHQPDGQFCVMEAAAYIAGEPWSDAPECVCPTIRTFMVSWNDWLPSDEDRDRLLKPLLLKVVGTRSTDEIAERRSYPALDWLIRVHTPKFLELKDELKPHAKTLRELDEIIDMAGATATGVKVRAARAAAGDAARAAARAAARDAAGDAAGAAAGAAARAAARDAARDAAGDAAGAAAKDFLQPTVEWLQASASDLVIRMCEITDDV